jgi:hypothetical protein
MLRVKNSIGSLTLFDTHDFILPVSYLNQCYIKCNCFRLKSANIVQLSTLLTFFNMPLGLNQSILSLP